MAIEQPAANVPLSNPDHSIMHRVIGIDLLAPVKEITVQSDGTTRIGDDGGGNYTIIEPDGFLIFNGDAVVWEDLRFPATRIRQGATQKPDFDTTNMGLLFPQNDVTEIAYIIGLTSHKMKVSSGLFPHIHFVQDSADEPIFKIDYRWYKNGADPTGGFTTITSSTFIFTYTAGTIAQIVTFPEIDGSAIDTIANIIEIKLYRDDNVVTGNVLVKEFDMHYEIDTIGSRTEFGN